MVDLKTLPSNWLRAFGPYLCARTQQVIKFHFKTNSGKTNNQIFKQFKKPYFWSIFYWKKEKFSKKSFSAIYNFIVSSNNIPQNLRKTNDLISKNIWTDERTGRMAPEVQKHQAKLNLVCRQNWNLKIECCRSNIWTSDRIQFVWYYLPKI